MREAESVRATRALRDVHELARLCGIQASYTDHRGRRRRASAEALLAALRAFGVPVERPEQAAGRLRKVRLARWRSPLEPVTVAWDGRLAEFLIRLPSRVAGEPAAWRVELEDGRTMPVQCRAIPGPAEDVEGKRYVGVRIVPDARVPHGYHRLRYRAHGIEATSFLISAPSSLPVDAGGRRWGVFLPLYALQSSRSWGVGDLTDLGDLVEWAAGLGGDMVATLPILSAFLDRPFEPSPYSAASKLFWNELFLDLTAAPELERSPEARLAMRSEHLRKEIENLRRSELVDLRGAMAAKRRVLEPLARTLFEDGGPRRQRFDAYVRDNAAILVHAAFRAATDRHGVAWQRWPQAERDGSIGPEGGDRAAFRYHCYAQWLAAEQVAAVDHRARAAGARLYFDVPLGVHPGGYDVWREREGFALDASVGAPPDRFFGAGQDWGFPPPHPSAIRGREYGYPIACLRHALRHAGVVRIDHVMGLHRLFWIPRGMPASEGVYVRYPAEEQYAVLVLEAARAGAIVVGEDLGVVPGSVRHAISRRGIHRSYVLPWELTGDPAIPMRPPPERSFASLGTHDMPPFAAFWEGADQHTRERLAAFLRKRGRFAGNGVPLAREALTACLGELAASEARGMTVNLEDLWLETRPQNVPGTTDAYPNWRRKARYPLERIRRSPRVAGALRSVDVARKGTSPS